MRDLPLPRPGNDPRDATRAAWIAAPRLEGYDSVIDVTCNGSKLYQVPHTYPSGWRVVMQM